LLGEDDEKPAKDMRQAPPTLEVAGLPGKIRKEMAETPPDHPKEAAVRGDAHDGLGHTQGDDLGVGGPASGVSLSLWQKIIGGAINNGAEGVQVGVHRGLRVDGVLDTVDLGPSASNPFFSATFVESII
jgi:hypothetical protein